MLTLRPPVSGSSLNEVLEKVRKGETTTMALPQGSVTTMDPTRVSAVPEALRAVTHKALARERERRYQSVEAFAADIEAYQNGFATSAETAGILRQLVLLVKRHRIASGFAAALLVGAVVFTLRLAASERRANDNALLARNEAASAAAHARRASEQSTIASANEQRALENEVRAVANERRALEQKESARKSAARAQIALAKAAEQNLNTQGIRTSLNGVDKDLRDQEWHYLNRSSDSAVWTREIQIADYAALLPHPENSGVLLALHKDGLLRSIDLTSGLAKDICKIEDTRNLALVDGLAISSDGQTAAITARNTDKNAPGKTTVQIHLVHLEDGTRVPLHASPSGYGPRDMAFSPDGKFLMERYGNGQATLFDTESRAVLWSKTEGSFELYHFQATGACRYIKASRIYALLAPRTGLDLGAMSKVPFNIPNYYWFLSDSNATQILYL
jgi:hypothetical protein